MENTQVKSKNNTLSIVRAWNKLYEVFKENHPNPQSIEDVRIITEALKLYYEQNYNKKV